MKPLKHRMRANATVEVLVTLAAVSPFLVGIPLLGKQLDIKHKTYDAARYSVWERTVWSNGGSMNQKTEEEISLESRDRTLGDPRTGLTPLHALREQGLSENPLWVDTSNRRIVNGRDATRDIDLVVNEHPSPVDVGYGFAAGVAYGEGPIERVADALRLGNLALNRRGFASASISMSVQPLRRVARSPSPNAISLEVQRDEPDLVHRATAAILSDTWSARDENTLGRRVDNVTTDEMIEELERPGRIMGMQARGKGQPLYGEGQYGWDPDLRPRSTVLPASYIQRR